MIFINRTQPPPDSLAIEKEKGDYAKEDVREQLQKDFHGKCYICEIHPIQDGGEVEHLIAHKKDKDKKFCWDNLFLSCGHCNGIKNRNEYEEHIINCTKISPSDLITHLLIEDRVRIELVSDNLQARTTCKLIEECFNGKSTTRRKYAASIRLDELKREMNIFYNTLNKYKKNKATYTKNQIQAKLDVGSKFTAFKRDYISLHSDKYSEFINW